MANQSEREVKLRNLGDLAEQVHTAFHTITKDECNDMCVMFGWLRKVYILTGEQALQAQPPVAVGGRLDYTNLYGKQLAQLEQWLFTESGVESVRWDVDGNLAKVVYRTPQPPSATIDAVLDILPDLLAGWWTGETDDGFQHETFEPYNDASRFTGILRAYVQYRKVRQALPQPAPPVATKAIPTINDATLQGKAEEKAIEEGT